MDKFGLGMKRPRSYQMNAIHEWQLKYPNIDWEAMAEKEGFARALHYYELYVATYGVYLKEPKNKRKFKAEIINVREVICIENKNEFKRGNFYFIDNASVFKDGNGNQLGDCYNTRGVYLGMVPLSLFNTIFSSTEILIEREIND